MAEICTILTDPVYGFVRLALVVSAIASVPFGLVGTFVVVRRVGYLAGAIAHCAFGGIGVGLYLNRGLGLTSVDPMMISLVVAIACAILIGVIKRYAGEREDTIIGAIWAIGMSVGLLCLDKTPAGNANISSYLFGDLYLISPANAIAVAVLAACVLIIVVFLFRHLEAVSFDEEHSKLRGLPATLYFQLLLVITAVTVVTMVQVVGMLLVVAMLTLPAAAAGRLTKHLSSMAVLAVIICFVFSWTGIMVSVMLNLSSGPTIIVVAAIGYFIVLGKK
ncbi:MAG: metal ABC transporter permease [Planctomycetaceae bacterium]|nr:metal ABC transporter permease [Planctomycetaceae bacterium]